jgi:hypothetical protein
VSGPGQKFSASFCAAGGTSLDQEKACPEEEK